VKTSSSTPLSKVFEAQNANPVCRMVSGSGPAFLLLERCGFAALRAAWAGFDFARRAAVEAALPLRVFDFAFADLGMGVKADLGWKLEGSARNFPGRPCFARGFAGRA
jgi:hypothetical protein